MKRGYLVQMDDVEDGKPKPTLFVLARSPRAALAAVGEQMLPHNWLSANFTVTGLRHKQAPTSNRLSVRSYLLVCRREINKIERNL